MDSTDCEDCNHADIPRYYAFGGEVYADKEVDVYESDIHVHDMPAFLKTIKENKDAVEER